jgi:hypothetical protein
MAAWMEVTIGQIMKGSLMRYHIFSQRFWLLGCLRGVSVFSML